MNKFIVYTIITLIIAMVGGGVVYSLNRNSFVPENETPKFTIEQAEKEKDLLENQNAELVNPQKETDSLSNNLLSGTDLKRMLAQFQDTNIVLGFIVVSFSKPVSEEYAREILGNKYKLKIVKWDPELSGALTEIESGKEAYYAEILVKEKNIIWVEPVRYTSTSI